MVTAGGSRGEQERGLRRRTRKPAKRRDENGEMRRKPRFGTARMQKNSRRTQMKPASHPRPRSPRPAFHPRTHSHSLASMVFSSSPACCISTSRLRGAHWPAPRRCTRRCSTRPASRRAPRRAASGRESPSRHRTCGRVSRTL